MQRRRKAAGYPVGVRTDRWVDGENSQPWIQPINGRYQLKGICMRIEIMIDKEQKISQPHWKPLNPSFTEICNLSIQRQQSAFAKARQMALSWVVQSLMKTKSEWWKLCSRSGKTTAGCIKERCWRQDLILTSARLNNEQGEALGYNKNYVSHQHVFGDPESGGRY